MTGENYKCNTCLSINLLRNQKALTQFSNIKPGKLRREFNFPGKTNLSAI